MVYILLILLTHKTSIYQNHSTTFELIQGEYFAPRSFPSKNSDFWRDNWIPLPYISLQSCFICWPSFLMPFHSPTPKLPFGSSENHSPASRPYFIVINFFHRGLSSMANLHFHLPSTDLFKISSLLTPSTPLSLLFQTVPQFTK